MERPGTGADSLSSGEQDGPLLQPWATGSLVLRHPPSTNCPQPPACTWQVMGLLGLCNHVSQSIVIFFGSSSSKEKLGYKGKHTSDVERA